ERRVFCPRVDKTGRFWDKKRGLFGWEAQSTPVERSPFPPPEAGRHDVASTGQGAIVFANVAQG
ncbi:MAG: hypothetical protein Q8N98_05260, partial [bacterium]|nr:hypothetical protein [bacterium]